MFVVAAEEQGVEAAKLQGTIQNDILKARLCIPAVRVYHVLRGQNPGRLRLQLHSSAARALPTGRGSAASTRHPAVPGGLWLLRNPLRQFTI